MKKRIHAFHRLHAQYNRYRRKLARVTSGQSRYARRDVLVKRLQRLYRQLMMMRERYRLHSIKIAVSAGMMVGAYSMTTGQSLNLKTNNPLQFAHIEGNARPVLIDWDDDGDLDLFVGGQVITALDSSSAGVAYYRNEGGFYNQAPSPFPTEMAIDGVGNTADGPDSVTVNLAFIDLDADGDQDAFVGQSNGTMLYYRNDEGAFSKADSSENPFHGIQIGGTSHAAPVFVDVDGDGDLDAVIGKYDGAIAYYVNNNDGTFTEQMEATNPFSDVSVSENASPTFADWDGDSDLDLIVGNKAGELSYYRNDDGVFITVDAAENPFANLSYANDAAPALGDVDGDGDLDVIIGDDFGDLFFLENNEGTLTEISRNTIGIGEDLSLSSSHAFTDIDGDGDQDIVRGSFEGVLAVLENTEGQYALAANNPLDTPIMVGYISQPAFADVDTDGDMDLFLGSYQDDIVYYANDAGTFTKVDGEGNPFNGINAGDNESIAFVDIDNDGDLDAFIGNKMGQVKYFENTDGVFAEVPASNPFEGISFEVPGNPNHPVQVAFADIDGDGNVDGYFGLIDGTMRVFKNMGDAGRSSVPTFVEQTDSDNPFNNIDFGRSASPAFGDVDGDGDLDLLITNAAGLTFHYENSGSTSAEDYQLTDQTKIYPNPAEHSVTLEVPWISEVGEVRVLDVSGRMVQQLRINQKSVAINIASLDPGLYFVKVSAANGQAIKKLWKL